MGSVKPPHWVIDSLQVRAAMLQLAGSHGGLEQPWGEEDAQSMEVYANAMMQALTQKTGGQEGYQVRNEAGDLVSFEDVWQITTQLALMAVQLVMVDGHKAAIGSVKAIEKEG